MRNNSTFNVSPGGGLLLQRIPDWHATSRYIAVAISDALDNAKQAVTDVLDYMMQVVCQGSDREAKEPESPSATETPAAVAAAPGGPRKDDDNDNEQGSDEEKEPTPPNVKYPGDQTDIAPGPDYEWRGQQPVGGDKGAWFNPKTGETWHPDLNHPKPIDPHWDYIPYKGGPSWRVYPDGRIILGH